MDNQTDSLLKLLKESGRSLYALLTRLTLREDVAEDLMQDLFIKLNNSKALAKAGNRHAYIRRCAINLAFDWRTKKHRNIIRLDEVREQVSKDKL